MNLIFKEAGRPWTPDILRGSSSGLSAWYDALDHKSITLNGSNVAAWADKSGKENNMAQTTAGNQPPYLTSASLGGKPIIGVDVNTGTVGLTSIQAFSVRQVFVMVQYSNGSASQFTGGAIYPTLISGPGINGAERMMMGSTATAAIIGSNFDGGVAYKNGSGSSSIVLPMPWSVVMMQGATTVSQVWSIGCNIVATGRTWNGYYAEFVFLSAIAPTNIQRKIEGYLAWKWGTQASLASDHPYRYHRPMR